MWKFLVGVLVGVVFTVLVSFILVFAIGRLFSAKQPTIAANSVLVLDLSGDIPEAAPVDVGVPFVQSEIAPTVRDIWTSLREATRDNRIKAVLVQPRRLSAGWGKLEELRQELLAFKKSGKPVYAFLQGPGSREYYLALAADKIFLSPDDDLNVKGFLVGSAHFKNTLDKLGVQMQVDHVGRYKDAGDIFTRTNMSPETREVLDQVLDQIYGEFCSSVGQARHKSVSQVQALIDNGPFLAEQAKSNGLVDELAFEDQVYSDVKKRTGLRDVNRVSIKTYFRSVPGRGDHIAILVGAGEIVRGDPDNATTNPELIASGAFAKLIRRVRNDGSIKGVILRVDSPGGDAVASDEILHELKLLSRAKPLVVSMSDVAASGGYYISMTGDPVLSYANTITGSIGVLYVRPNVRGLYDKLGIQQDILSRGKLASMDSLYVPLSDAARQKLHQSIESIYHSFVGKVAAARKKTYDQIDPVAQGRVWMGAQARQVGLVDQLGGLDDAVAYIRKKANLSATGDTNLIMYPPRRTLFEVLTSTSPDAFESQIAERRLRQIIPGLPRRIFLEGGALQIMPYQFTIQ